MSKEKSVSDARRLNFWMKNSLVSQIDEYAEKLGINRSAAISVLCSQALNAAELSSNVSVLNEMYKSMLGGMNENSFNS